MQEVRTTPQTAPLILYLFFPNGRIMRVMAVNHTIISIEPTSLKAVDTYNFLEQKEKKKFLEGDGGINSNRLFVAKLPNKTLPFQIGQRISEKIFLQYSVKRFEHSILEQLLHSTNS